MTVASGARPYGYVRYPFILQDGERIGVSGILFEEPMFVLLAEKDMYEEQTGSDRYFYKYFGNGGPEGYATKVGFEPRSDGGNLDGSWQYPVDGYADNPLHKLPGMINVKDYILDLRAAIEDVWTLIAEEDSDYSTEELQLDYFSGIFNGERDPNDVDGPWYGRDTDDWLHDEDAVGQSGTYFDVDLREVQYQPHIRFSNYQTNSYWPLPVWPPLCTSNGGLPGLYSNDYPAGDTLPAGPGNLVGINESGYDAIDSGSFLLVGDVFIASNSKAYLYDMSDGTRASNTTANCVGRAGRVVNKYMDGGIGYFQHGNYGVPQGLYRIGIFQSTPSNTLIESGFSSFWPPQSADLSDFNDDHWKITADGTIHRASGIHVFNDGFWGTGGNGQVLYSPINGAAVWYRGADTTSLTGTYFTFAWPAAYYNGGNHYSWSVYVTGSYPSFQETPEVATWDVDGDSPSVATAQYYTRVDPVGAGGIVDLSNHAPFSGVSLSAYTILLGWESSDGVARFSIWDGIQCRGSVNCQGFGFAQASPGLCGTIGGEIYANSPTVGDKHPRYFMQQNYEQASDVFPLPASSGSAAAATAQATGPYYITYGTGVMHDFEQMDNTNFTMAGRVVFIQPTGDLDIGDGSALMAFNAKLKGQSSTSAFYGRIITATSGGQKQIQIIDYWPVAGTVLRCGDFT